MENLQSDSNMFSVRIVSIDYYMSSPIPDFDICYSSFQGEKVNEVPIIRIYGSTPAGQKTCLHVHRALPYLYVPCSKTIQTSEEGDSYTREMSIAIEKALNSKMKSATGSKRQHVHGCSLVRARKFYGFHPSEELFDGAVLDRSFQPHESHIPYLLQFLIDYNLYGMGHLHVSKVKFRYPLFDRLIQRAVENLAHTSANDQADSSSHSGPGSPIWTSVTVPSGWMWPPPNETDSSPDKVSCLIRRQSTCELEADAIVEEIVNQQFKMYSSLSQTRSDVRMVQSLVPIWQEEYERTGMHEAVTYSEPSKPLPEHVLKMLSHGPEYEDALMDMFRVAENQSSSQNTPTKEAERFLQSIRSLADVGSLCDSGEYVNPNCSNEGSFQCCEERNRSGSGSLQGSFSKQNDEAVPSESSHSYVEIVAANEEVLSFEKLENSALKGIDTEALGLLKWLASSQGAEELITDDELDYDVILSPLLPKIAIEKILERANLDYECVSQQECQDILDSVVDTKSSVADEGAVNSISDNSSTQMPSETIIPQVDGSCDDLITGSVGNLSEVDMTSEMGRSSHRALEGEDLGPSSEKRKHSKLRGSLPISAQPVVSDDSESSGCNSTDVSKEMKSSLLSSSSGKKDNKIFDHFMNDANAKNCGLKEQKELAGSSMRDLMRRKRCRRVESSEVGTCKVKDTHLGIEEEETSLSPKRLEFNAKNSDMEGVLSKSLLGETLFSDQEATAYERSSSLAVCTQVECPKVFGIKPLMSCNDSPLHGNTSKNEHFTSHKREDDIKPFSRTRSFVLEDVSLLHSETKEVPKFILSLNKNTTSDTGKLDGNITERSEVSRCLTSFVEKGQKGHTAVNLLPEVCSDCYGSTNAGINADAPPSEHFTIQPNIQTGLSSPSLSLATTEGMHTKSIEMSFSKKPPTMEWTFEDASFAPVGHGQTFVADMETSEEVLSCNSNPLDFKGSDADGALFFPVNVQDGEEEHKSYRDKEGVISFHAVGLGIPTHYQNDGSVLYLLTTKYSPPSVDCVREWLFRHPPRRDATGASNESICSRLPDLPSPSSGNSLEFLKKNSRNDCETSSKPLEVRAVLTGENDMLNLKEVLVDVNHGTLSKSVSVPFLECSSDQVTEKHGRNLKAKNNIYEVSKLHCEGTKLKGGKCNDNWRDVSQISGPDVRSKLTPLSQIGFRDSASAGDGQQLTLMSIEVQAESRGDLRPDPRFDAITVITLIIQDDNDYSRGAFVLLRGIETESNQRNLDGISGYKVIVNSEEKNLFYHFVKIVRLSDPDIMMGWDIQGGSLGYLAERAAHLGVALLNNISRTPPCESKVSGRMSTNKEIQMPDHLLPEALISDPTVFGDGIIDDEWGRTHASGVHVGGRIVLNIWRLMRGEVKLNMYTIEAVAEEVLRRKVPSIPPRILTLWFFSGPGRARFRCIEYIMERAKLNLEIMNQLDMINRTSELARVFGIDFFSVLSRGSQYRVESMFLRLAHTQNYLAISPGNQQVASQPAMECLPLVMEPESRFYSDPVIVLDFQSLYPSMIIAYNLCFCTCLGKVIPAKANTLGVSSYLPDPQLLIGLNKNVLLTPNGVMYVPSNVRKGVLPRLLEEILSTRIMVKRAMKKLTSSQRVLHRIFNARQLALKLISNVTYGYTAAGFSGRMPCAELADSIVQCGRRTLENAIAVVNSHDKWNARVIYGDTDSMFVLLKGRTVNESFRIGQEIASVITGMNPDPVTLKMEKVYHPCFLLTKKRYVGYSYETSDQADPLFDAKGIETVRRDSCGAVAKTLEKSLKLFFEHHDISKVQVYLQRQWTRILSGRVSLQDFVFAKEVRLGTYSTRLSSLPPAAIVATKAMKVDPRAEPRYAERIPYVVIHGEPGARLVDMVVDPLDLLALESPYRLNDSYYINKQIIPALQRVFGLVGADLKQWFVDMPRSYRPALDKRSGQRSRIDSYYLSRHCLLCGELVQASNHVCDRCSQKAAAVAIAVSGRTSKLERDIQHLAAICQHCGGGDSIVESGIKCVSLACTVFYERRKVQKELQALSGVASKIGLYPSFTATHLIKSYAKLMDVMSLLSCLAGLYGGRSRIVISKMALHSLAVSIFFGRASIQGTLNIRLAVVQGESYTFQYKELDATQRVGKDVQELIKSRHKSSRDNRING
ncbi:Dna polymerase zeta catalytic subunit [Thalictrum thalictroides]|uniref:DNA polymerase zeta catalytic subunit n=1 Tax=Thalictrum thalictroides TaxID=46969 RepID=A0A7J6V1E0_THATH|nr:Dna polymerase zeta catalytic subunit [Thalictrum thalictroides]